MTEQIINADNPIARLNPLTKIAAVFSFGLSAMIFPWVWGGGILLIILAIIAIVAKLFAPFMKLILTLGIPMAVMLIFIQGGYSDQNKTTIAQIWFVTLGLEGTLYALRIVLTVLTFVGSFYLMNKTTDTSRLVAALAGTGMPPKVGYLVLSSLNVVPQMQRRVAVIQEAQTARGLSAEGGPISRLKAYLPILGPVVMSSLTDAQERGMTLETRGFGVKGVRQSSYIEVPFSGRDVVVCLVLAALFILAVVAAILVATNVWGG